METKELIKACFEKAAIDVEKLKIEPNPNESCDDYIERVKTSIESHAFIHYLSIKRKASMADFFNDILNYDS